ncbi:MAG: hypothetical protein IT241_11050 [Bacteroidia bacterium]|nr:hypothetical protein [Bacteroidia bacterium]
MKHLTLAILSLLFLSNNLYGQNRYAIFLTDKNNSPFSFTIPLDYLSQRAIDRRIKQNIPIDSSDFPVNPSYISQIAAAGATVLTASRWLNAVTIEVPGSSVLNTIYSLPFVKLGYAVNRNANSVYSTKDKFKMENTLHSEQSRKIPEDNKVSSFDYGPSYDQIAMLNGDMLHNSGKTGQGKVIAVIDAGFFNADNMIVFDSLRNQNRLLGTWDFVDQNSMVYDDYAHGTYVLSIMAGNWPGNIVGTAPHAEYWLLRSENAFSETPMEEFTWAAAAEFADSVGADIINSSLGYYEFDNPSQNFIYAD